MIGIKSPRLEPVLGAVAIVRRLATFPHFVNVGSRGGVGVGDEGSGGVKAVDVGEGPEGRTAY